MISNDKNYYKDSENLLPLFMDVTNDLFVVVRLDDEFKIEFINSCNFLGTLGYSHDSLVGTSFLDLIYSDDKKKIINLLMNNVISKNHSEEMRIETSEHNTRWIEITLRKFKSKFTANKILINLKDISKQKDLESKLSAAQEQFMDKDITERKLVEQKLNESEEKFRTLFELAPASTVVSDAEGKIILCNQKFCELHDIKNPELLKGRTVLKFFAKKDWPKLTESIKKVAEGITLEPIQYTMLKEDGTEFQAEANSSGIRDKNGKIVNLIGVAQDITERHKAEQRLRDSEEKYRELVDLLPDIIFETDNTLNLTYVNSVAFTKFGYTPEDLKSGLNISSIIHPEYKEKAFLQTKSIFEGKKTKPNDYLLCKKDGGCFYARIHSRPIFKEGKVAGIRGTITDIDDMVKAEQKLKESAEKYRLITENSRDLVYTLDMNLNNTYISPSVTNMLGYDVDEALLMNPRDNTHNDDLEKIAKIYKEEFKIELNKSIKKDLNRKRVFTVREKHKAGSLLTMEHTLSWLRDDSGIAVGILGVARNITEKRHTEKLLKESEEKYRLISENANDLIAVLDLNLNYEYLNKGYEVLGYSIEEIYKTSAPDLVHPEDVKKAVNAFRTGIKEGANSEELRIKHKDGHYSWFEVKGKIFRDRNEDPKALLISRDITERKKIEDQLKESEEKYHSLFENMNAGFAFHEVIVDDSNKPIDYKYLEVNSKFEELTGMKKENLIGKAVTEAIPGTEKDPADWIGKFGKVGMTGIPLTVEDYSEAIDKWFKVSGYSPKKGFFAVTFTDITDRKKTEERLKASEEKYRQLFENSPIALMEQDYSDMKRYLNHLKASGINDFNKYFDEKPEEIVNCGSMVKIIDVNKKILEVYKANSKEDFKARVIQPSKDIANITMTEELLLANKMEILSLINGETMSESEIVSKTLTGDIIYLYAKASIVPGFESTWSKIIVSLVDITEEKLTDQKLKESEEKYRTIADQSILAITIIQDNLIKYINHRGANLLGYTIEEITKWSTSEYARSIHPDDRQLVVEQARKKQLNDPEVIDNYQFRCIKKTGEIIWVDNYSKTIEYEGSPADLSTAIDITEMKKAQQALEESEEKYHQLFETSPDGVVLADSEGKIIECNSAIENITGYSISEFIGKSFLELEVYDENTKNLLLNGFKALYTDNKIEFIEFQIIRQDGEVRWMQVTGSLITIKAKNHMLGVLHDITTIKNAEEALKKSREKYRDLLETSSIGVLEIDALNNQIKYINPKLLEIIGYKIEELTDADIRNKIIHPKDLTKLMETNEERELEFRIIDKNGKLKWISGKRLPHFDDHDNLISTRLWLEDITEKKMYEELIYELNVNFLNFTADIQNNIKLLLNTGLKLLNGDLIVYAHRVKPEDQELFNIITSDNDSHTYNFKEFSEKLLINEFFKEGHDFPQTFPNIDQGSYFNSDPFIKKIQAKGSFGKVIRSQDGLDSIICVFYKKNPIINGQDKLVLFLICDAIEIEQRRWQVQQDLEEQNITLNKINTLKTELLSRTSHELKTPLISIKGFTELLLTLHKSKLDPETISILDEIKDGSKRLEKIINLLLESAKLEAGQLELKKNKEDLTFLINFCVKELKGLVILRNQSILFDPNTKVEAMIDKERIYEVISNLLLNAVKYTSPGGTISIQIHTEDKEYIISVTDNGIGFTEEEKKQVFKQFGKIERYGQGWDVAIEGTGLGLYITKKLVELHGGRIWFTSEGRNKGTTFKFSIPM